MQKNPELFLENFPDAILELDKDGYIRYVNRAACMLTGFSREQLLNKLPSFLYLNNDNDTQLQYDLQVARQRERVQTEGWRERSDKLRFWGQLTIGRIQDEAGQFDGYSCLLQDVSLKKAADLELRKKEERYRLIVDGIQEYSIIMLDAEGNVLTWNDGAMQIMGYDLHEAIGKHFSLFYTTDDVKRGKPDSDLRTAKEAGKFEDEGWKMKKNGFFYWADVVVTPLYNERNRLIGFSQITRDLTDHKANEESLRQSEDRYRLFVSQVRDYAIFMLDEKGRIASWNEGARRIKGYEEREIIGKYFSIFYTEEDIISGKPPLELTVAQAEGKYEEEGWRIRKDGTRFWANVVITAVYNADRRLVGFSKVTRDLTERVANERALRDSFERYRMIAEELKVTNGELSYANQELEQFTSIVSHDLQEPIRTIKSFLQLISMKLGPAADADLTSYITKAILSADRMRELIQNLLQYSQLDKTSVAMDRIVVRDLFGDALQNLRASIIERKAVCNVNTSVETVTGDRIQLGQVCQNLLSNALKFSDHEHPQIDCDCVEENGMIRLSVRDNGIGIAAADQDKVFEIFRRLNTKNKYPGTGIGLAICKKIADRHGGKIWCESEKGRGTTFYFTLNKESTTV